MSAYFLPAIKVTLGDMVNKYILKQTQFICANVQMFNNSLFSSL